MQASGPGGMQGCEGLVRVTSDEQVYCEHKSFPIRFTQNVFFEHTQAMIVVTVGMNSVYFIHLFRFVS